MFHFHYFSKVNISFPIQWKKVVKELTAGKAIICHISSKKKRNERYHIFDDCIVSAILTSCSA